MANPNPFLVLDVPEDASDATIRKAYLDLVRRHPPETDPERFQAIAKAYRTLSDPDQLADLLFLGQTMRPSDNLRDLVPPEESRRNPLGIDRWLRSLGEARKGR